MSTNATPTQEGIAQKTITGPHIGRNRAGHLDHDYYRCENCGLETTDDSLTQDGCFRCNAGGR